LDGWVLISNNNGIAQLKKIRNFNWLVFWLGLFLGIIIGIFYLIDYAANHERIVTLALDRQGKLITNTGKYWVKTLILIFIVVIVMMLCIFAIMSQSLPQ
jgi:hypothetical protein